jgi:hypothetical protein
MWIHIYGHVVSYPLFVRRNFVVCRHVTLTNQAVPLVKKVSGTLHQGNECG